MLYYIKLFYIVIYYQKYKIILYIILNITNLIQY